MIFIHDVSSTYRVPILLEEQGIIKYFKQRLNLPIDDQPSDLLMKWKKMADRYFDSCCSFRKGLNSGQVFRWSGTTKLLWGQQHIAAATPVETLGLETLTVQGFFEDVLWSEREMKCENGCNNPKTCFCQIWKVAEGVFHSSRWQVHKTKWLLCICFQGSGALCAGD